MTEQTGASPSSDQQTGSDEPGPAAAQRQPVVVLSAEGMAIADAGSEAAAAVGAIEQPAKVMRIGSMIRQLLEEVRNAPLDDAGRARMAQVHERSLAELEDGLSPELVDELRRISLPFGEGATPTDAELRIAQAQLVGWLEGLFHGIQTALVAQQMAARAQLEQMRRALPGPGQGGQVPGGGLGQPGGQGLGSSAPAPGQYL